MMGNRPSDQLIIVARVSRLLGERERKRAKLVAGRAQARPRQNGHVVFLTRRPDFFSESRTYFGSGGEQEIVRHPHRCKVAKLVKTNQNVTIYRTKPVRVGRICRNREEREENTVCDGSKL